MKRNLKVKHLITESDMHDYDLIKESTNDGSTLLKLAGPFAVCETLNNNNRMYHLEEMVEECKKYQEVINAHRVAPESRSSIRIHTTKRPSWVKPSSCRETPRLGFPELLVALS